MSFILSILLTTLQLKAEPLSNGELLDLCQDKAEAAQNFCYGYIISAANAAQLYRNILDIDHSYVDICFPPTIGNKDIVNLYIKWAKNNPSRHKDPAVLGVSTSFSRKYTCPKEEEPNPSPTRGEVLS